MKHLLLLVVASLVWLTACSTPPQPDTTGSTTKESVSESETKDQSAVDSVPDFNLVDKDGNQVSLSDYSGKKVYINVWASWCGPCKREMPELEEVYQDVKDREDLVFLSVVSADDGDFGNKNPADESMATILEVADDLGVTYPVYSDQGDRFMNDYQIQAFPTHLFINSDGTLNQRISGGLSASYLEEILDGLE